jgi:vancomycin permeability regulator SanA
MKIRGFPKLRDDKEVMENGRWESLILLLCSMLKQARAFLNKHKWVKWTIAVFFTWFVIHATYITIDGLRSDDAVADVAIILGNRVNEDGSLAPWTQGRVDKALELYRQGKVKYIFASGGITRETNYPEGTGMKSYLVANGVPDSAVIADNKGINTFFTATNFLEWNQQKGFGSAIIVSQFYHITRSKYILRKLGFNGSIHAASSEVYNWNDILGTAREVPAFYKYLLVY